MIPNMNAIPSLTREQVLDMIKPLPVSDEGCKRWLRENGGKLPPKKDVAARDRVLREARLMAGAEDRNWSEKTRATFNRWLARGDGLAVYRNAAMDSSGCGNRKYVSFGSKEAQIETDEPPQRLPDIGNQINWMYQLEGVFRGESLDTSADTRPDSDKECGGVWADPICPAKGDSGGCC